MGTSSTKPSDIVRDTVKENWKETILLGFSLPLVQILTRKVVSGKDGERSSTGPLVDKNILVLSAIVASFYLGSKFGSKYSYEKNRPLDYNEFGEEIQKEIQQLLDDERNKWEKK